jgi:hypothetical protein
MPARSSSEVEKQAGLDAWKLNVEVVLPARSSSEVEKQAGEEAWKLNVREARSPRGKEKSCVVHINIHPLLKVE